MASFSAHSMILLLARRVRMRQPKTMMAASTRASSVALLVHTTTGFEHAFEGTNPTNSLPVTFNP